jgi:hypothetical protein
MGTRQQFETPEQERLFLKALQRRRIPLKFAYAGPAAAMHDRLTRTEGYQAVSVAAQHEVAVGLRGVDSANGYPEMLEIGPGNGVHSQLILNELERLDRMPARFLALDFSATLRAMAEVRLRSYFPGLQVSMEPWDFELGRTERVDRWRGSNPVLATMVGNTLGNVDDPIATLNHVRESLQSGDVLVLGLASSGGLDDRELLIPYATDIFIAAALEPLKMVGVDTAAGRFESHFDHERRAVVGDFFSGRDEVLEVDGVTVSLGRGERVECFLSQRFEEEDVAELAASTDWSLLSADLDSAGTHLAVVLRAS